MSQNSRAAGRILVVDDERNVRRLLVEVLGDEGYQASAVEGVEGLRRQLDEGDVDLVLLDVCLPGEGGLQWLRETPRRPAVIMMSGHATIDDAVEATRLGALDFLEKPISGERLRISVQNALQIRRLERENARLRAQGSASSEMIGDGNAMHELRHFIDRAAPTDATVLITGEHGTGKELVARALHLESPRCEGPFVRVNCAAIPRDLLESELFGHERGAFSGAVERRRGRFEVASGGTLLLDEIGDMEVALQSKLLRVLEERELTRVGGEKSFEVDVRVLASTNRDLPELVSEGRFRPDLYYRLNVLTVDLPPLRDRREDIPLLAEAFVAEFAERHGRCFTGLRSVALDALLQHGWPGNVRELRNVIERAVVLSEGPWIEADDLGLSLGGDFSPAFDGGGPLRQRIDHFERELILHTLEESGGNVAEAARRLQTDRANLYRRMRRLGLRASSR